MVFKAFVIKIMRNKMKKTYKVVILASILSILFVAVAASAKPGPQFLASTMECEFTPELKTLAKKLGGDPIKIYHWVYKNIEYEYYDDSRKGAQATYFTKKGNELDQCSLLITLLRISGIPARYVLSIKPKSRRNTSRKYRRSSTIKTAFVDAYITTENYRGIGKSGRKDWVRLAPWHKEIEAGEGINIFKDRKLPPELEFDPISYMLEMRNQSPVEIFYSNLKKYVNEKYPGKNISDISSVPLKIE